MKRDMDLCREILRRVEAHPGPDWVDLGELSAERGEQVVSYHVYLLADDGLLVSGEPYPTNEGIHWPAHRLTAKGHDFIEKARNDTVWRKAKERLLSVGGGLTVDLILAALKAEISNRTGLDLRDLCKTQPDCA